MLGLGNNLVSANFVDVYQSNKALQFDGTNDYLAIADDSSLDITSAITVSAWIKPTASMAWKGILSKSANNAPTSSEDVWDLYVMGTDKIRFQVTTSDIAESTTVLTNGQWYFVTGTYDGANVKLYINATLEDTEARTADIPTNNEPLKIGSYYSTSNYFTGYIDECAIWNTALSANAITAIYNNGKPTDLRSNSGNYTSASSLVGYWQLGDGKLGADVDGTDDVIFDMDNASLGTNLSPEGGTFDDNTGWDFARAGWDATDGVARGDFSATTDTYLITSSTISDLSNKVVKFQWEQKNVTAGGVAPRIFAPAITGTTTTDTGNSVQTEYIHIGSGHDQKFSLQAKNNFVGDIDNFTVQVVQGNPAIMTNFPSGAIQTEVPKQVKGLPAVANTYSLDFDGTDDYVDCGNPTTILDDSVGTISLWAKTTASGSLDIMFAGSDASDASSDLTISKNASEKLWIFVRDDDSYELQWTSSDSLSADTWYHIAFAVGSSSNAIYINGSLASGTYNTGSASTQKWFGDVGGIDTMLIGAREDSSGKEYYWQGRLDEVAIFNTALDADSIRAIYNNGVETNLKNNTGAYDEYTDNLVAYYRMGDGTLDDYPLIGDEVTPTLGSELISDNNSGLNNSVGDWATNNASIRSVTTAPSSGTYHLEAHTATSNHGCASLDLNSLVTSGNIYKINFKARNSGGGNADSGWRCGLNASSSATGTAEINFTEMEKTDTTYVEYTHHFVANANSRYFIAQERGDGTGGIYIDELSLKLVNGNPSIMTNMTSGDIVEDTP